MKLGRVLGGFFGARMGMLSRAFLFLAVMLALVPVSRAQITGTITGTVYDNSGAIIPGAKVALTNQATGDVRTTESDTAGYFAFASLVPGTYSVKIEKQGFKSFRQSDMVLQASDKRNVNATLEVGQASETVTVEAHSDIVPVDSPAHALDLTAEDYNRLPMITRNATELLRDLPGAITIGNGSMNGASSNMDFSGVGAAGSSVGNGVSISGAPYRGGTQLEMDGTNILDEGCDCTSIATPNPDMIQEVKVQTSAFGANSPKGPVVIDFITKSGGNAYHGAGYLYSRNAIFNANDWQDNHLGKPVATGDHYYYPGGNFGGPVPLTHKKLTFWAGYEHFYQLSSGGTKLFSYVPTADMAAGNFGQTAANNALCQADKNVTADSTATAAQGTYCYAPEAGGLGPGGAAIAGPNISGLMDPGAKALMAMIEKWDPPNANPATTPGGYNYFFPVSAQHNGYVFRGRGDYNLDQNNQIFVTYQYSSDSQPSDGESHMWWLPGNSVEFPGGGLFNDTQVKDISAGFLHIFSPTLTNQMNAYWTYYNSPQSPVSFGAVQRGTAGYPAYPTLFSKSVPLNKMMVPGWNGVNYALPDFSQWDVFSQNGGSYYIRKENPAFSDDLTKIIRNHTLQAGFYYEMTGNNQGNFNPYNGAFSFAGISNPASTADAITGAAQGTQNPTANFMMGIATNYSEQISLPLNDQAYKTFSFYGMDSWKMTRRFTFDYGIRLEHIGHWYDRDGYGNAVWDPGPNNVNLIHDVLTGKLFPGVEWHAIDPGIPLSGTPNRLAHFAPRFGIAYDIFGNGDTVVRGGWGVYYFGDQVNDYSGPLALAQQSISNSYPAGKSVLFSEVGQLPKPTGIFAQNNTSPGFILNPNDYDVSYSRNWNFTIDQKLPWNSRLEVAYEGNHGGALFFGGQVGGGGNLGGGDLINVNKTPLGALFGADPFTGSVATDPENPCGTYQDGTTPVNQGGAGGCIVSTSTADYRPYGVMDFGQLATCPWGGTLAKTTEGSTKAGDCLINVYGTNAVHVEEHKGYSNYNALEVMWTKQAGKFTFNTSLLWSKALGFGNGDINPFNMAADYVVLNIDRPWVWNTSYSYSLGNAYRGGNKILGGAANGWSISGFTTWQKGANLQAQTSQNLGLGFVYAAPYTGGFSQKSFYGTDAAINVQPIETCNAASGVASNQVAKLSCLAAPAVPAGAPQELALAAGGFAKIASAPYSRVADGPAQLPYISMPAFWDSDLAIYKDFHVTERQTIEFRVTATNWLNHPLTGFANNNPLTLGYSLDPTNKGAGYQFNPPGGISANGSNWGYENTKSEPGPSQAYGRVMQFGLKYSF